MKLQVQSYNNGGTAYNAEAEETNFRTYSIDHEFGKPAKAVIMLADLDGSMLQKYNADANDVYLGVGKVTIEDPDGTDIFYGRIKRVVGDSEDKSVTLECYDWLDQLDEEVITYDMREDLDGAGLRQSTIASDYDDTDGEGIAPCNTDAPAYYVYDKSGILTADAHNGMYFVVQAFGSQKVKTGPYTYTATPSDVAMLVDTFVGVNPDNIRDLWVDDDDYYSCSDGADFTVDFNFKTWITDSTQYVAGSITGARIYLIYEGFPENNDVSLEVYNGATYDTIDRVAGDIIGTRINRTFEINEGLLASMHDANGEAIIRLNVAEATGGTGRVYYLKLEVDAAVEGYSASSTISDGETYRLTQAINFESVRLWEGAKYCICQPIYKHIASDETPGGLITDGGGDKSGTGPDPIIELTAAATIEHTAGLSTKQYKNRTRLQILKDLADQDKASFWTELGTATVTWKKTFGADTMQLTDTKINMWRAMMDYGTVVNSYDVYGARVGDYEIYQQSENAASILKFLATRSKVVKSGGVTSDYDASAVGTTLVARDAEPLLMVTCTITGNTATAAHATTIKLGEIVEITSSYLWPTAAKDYIVTRWAYDSEQHMTYLTMEPKGSIGRQPLDTPTTQSHEQKEALRNPDPYVTDNITHEV